MRRRPPGIFDSRDDGRHGPRSLVEAEAQAFLHDARAQTDIRARFVEGELMTLPRLNLTQRVYLRRCFQPLLWDPAAGFFQDRKRCS